VSFYVAGVKDGKGKGKGKGKNKLRTQQESQLTPGMEAGAGEEPAFEDNILPAAEDAHAVGAEDESFFAEHAKYSGFLSNLKLEAPVAGKINSRKERVEAQKAAAKGKKQKQQDRASAFRGSAAAGSGSEASADESDGGGDESGDSDEGGGGERAMALVERGGRRTAARWGDDEDENGDALRQVHLQP
jgi:hypothetical protein